MIIDVHPHTDNVALTTRKVLMCIYIVTCKGAKGDFQSAFQPIYVYTLLLQAHNVVAEYNYLR